MLWSRDQPSTKLNHFYISTLQGHFYQQDHFKLESVSEFFIGVLAVIVNWMDLDQFVSTVSRTGTFADADASFVSCADDVKEDSSLLPSSAELIELCCSVISVICPLFIPLMPSLCFKFFCSCFGCPQHSFSSQALLIQRRKHCFSVSDMISWKKSYSLIGIWLCTIVF